MRPPTRVEGDEPSGSSAERSLRLLAQLARTTPGLVAVELLPDGDDCRLRTPGVNDCTQLGQDTLRQMLLPVLVLELSRAAPH